jgi:hypothetical protein
MKETPGEAGTDHPEQAVPDAVVQAVRDLATEATAIEIDAILEAYAVVRRAARLLGSVARS